MTVLDTLNWPVLRCPRLAGFEVSPDVKPTRTECERLWEAYDSAAQSYVSIERNSAIETGLQALKRKASNRCDEARKAVEDHEATHVTGRAVAGASGG